MVHPFVQMPSEPRTVRVTLVELLKISRGWCEESPSIELLVIVWLNAGQEDREAVRVDIDRTRELSQGLPVRIEAP